MDAKNAKTIPQEMGQSAQEALADANNSKPLPLDEQPTQITITIPTQAYFVSGIRDFVLNMTQNLTGFSEQWAFRFQAVVDELCNNAIEHGSAPGKIIKITMLSVKNQYLEVSIEDSGTGPEKRSPEDMKALYKQRQQMITDKYMGFRGRGLPKIVGEWTDELFFEASDFGGLKVRVKKYLRKEEDEVSSKQPKDHTHLVIQ